MNNILHFKDNFFEFIRNLTIIVVLVCISSATYSEVVAPINNRLFLEQLKTAKVTINSKNKSLDTILDDICKQAKVLYALESGLKLDREQKYSLEVKSVSVVEALDILLKNAPYTYLTIGDKIIVKKKTEPNGNLQSKKITAYGNVLDRDKKPIVGATVIVIGTPTGAITDEKGAFNFLVDSQSNIEVSFAGKKSIVINVGSQSKAINVVLDDDAVAVDDVVVTGYFNKNKESYTGAATSFSGDELRQINPVNILSALSIIDPSFKLVENNSAGSNPNVIPEFEVRGSSSMPNVKNEYEGNPNMPTFILDGFEVTAEKIFDLDPMRIESITLLKDAAATAIYGSRAANGVVVITTKMPKFGTIRLSYNLDISFSFPDLTDYDLLNASEKLEVERASGFYGSIVPHMMEERELQYNNKKEMVQKGYDTYWLNKPIRSAVGHKHSINVEGGENSIRYGLDLTYDSAPGLMKESSRSRLGVGMMLQYQLNNLMFKNHIMYDAMTAENSSYGSYSEYARANPYYAYEDNNGEYLYLLENDKRGSFSTIPNPLYNSQLHVIDQTKYSYFVNNFSIDWQVFSGLRLKGNVAIRHKKDEGIVFKPAKHTDFANYSEENMYRKGMYNTTEGLEFGYDANIVASYFYSKNEHYLSINAALNIQDMSKNNYSVTVEGFPDENLDYITFGAQYHESRKPTGKDEISRLIGFVGNVNYSYMDKYFIDGSLRTDASSRFGSNSRWAPFGSVGIGWNVHKEKFVREHLSFISRFKIRGSIGWVGSQNFDPFQAIPKYEYNVQDRYRYGIGANLKGIANRNLKWQQTTQRNIGTDIEFLNRRIMVTFNYYKNSSNSLLSNITLPPSLGFGTYMANVGQIENKGYDFKVRATLIRNKNGNLNVSLGAMHNRNRLMKISNSLTAWNESQDKEITNAPRVRYIEGQSLNTIWAVKSMGINPANGKELFIDRNGKRVDEWKSEDQKPIGVKDSDIEGNMSISGGYKGFQLSVYMNYRLGGQEYNNTLVSRVENADKRYNCDRRVLEDRWREPGDVTFFKDIFDGTVTQATSRFIQNYNFLQVSSVSLSYDFRGKWMKACHLQGLRLSFFMNDVARWSSIKAERGLDYPFARNFRTALRVTF